MLVDMCLVLLELVPGMLVRAKLGALVEVEAGAVLDFMSRRAEWAVRLRLTKLGTATHKAALLAG
jgi:hypothetical protein